MLVFCLTCSPVHGASYVSYNDLSLDYDIDNEIYGAGKNGYTLLLIKRIKGNNLYYTYTRFLYDEGDGHRIYKNVGKTYRAKLTKKTRYYKSAPYSYVGGELKAYQYGYDSAMFKNLGILQEVSKSTAINSEMSKLWYAKIKNGKITTLINPVIFAI